MPIELNFKSWSIIRFVIIETFFNTIQKNNLTRDTDQEIIQK